jgi:threonine dehydrogenase-like Zn-dependent dehydrogenase
MGPNETVYREFDMPEIEEDAALIKVEIAGICGSDVKNYAKKIENVIMGHENVGVVAKAGKKWAQRKGLKEGDRIMLEHYLPCMRCEWCHQGEYRHCKETDWHTNPGAIRYGYTSADTKPHLWGGFAHYLYAPWNAVCHKIPDNVTPELAGIATPLSNGVQWALFEAGVGFGSKVLIQGPGQQGLAQIVACKATGAEVVIITGTTKDAKRLEVAKALGADVVIDVMKQDPLEEIMKATGGIGVDCSIDCTAGAGTAPMLLGISALKRKAGKLVIQGNEKPIFPDFPIYEVTKRYGQLISARGHSYKACEMALRLLASHKYPLEKALTHIYGLDQVDWALKSVAGKGDPDVIHVSVAPWKKAA